MGAAGDVGIQGIPWVVDGTGGLRAVSWAERATRQVRPEPYGSTAEAVGGSALCGSRGARGGDKGQGEHHGYDLVGTDPAGMQDGNVYFTPSAHLS